MKHAGRKFALEIFYIVLLFALSGCGASPWRYDAGSTSTPAGLVATPGNQVVQLNWVQVGNAQSYTIYYATAPGVTATNSTRIANVAGSSSSTLVGSLSNDTPYYFRISATNANGESALSAEVTATPSLRGVFLQSDLAGTWRFNALVSGADAKWMRGTVEIDAAGAVSVGSFLDSAGATTAPAGLFSAMSILSDGSVSEDGASAGFHGMLSGNLYRDLLVGSNNLSGSSRMLVILQKSVPGILFAATDIQGTGQQGAGPLPMVYHQFSSGAIAEWEWGSFQVGRDQAETYTAINAPSVPALPGAGAKVVGLTLTSDGLISETAKAGVTPQPGALLSNAVMSADKMTIVGTATDSRGAYLLRVIQLVHPPTIALTATSYLLGDLAGSYGYHALTGGATPGWAYGGQTIGSSGNVSFATYLTSNGATATPAPYALALDQQGKLITSADPAYHGQYAYLKDLLVATGTDSGGAGYLSVALKR